MFFIRRRKDETRPMSAPIEKLPEIEGAAWKAKHAFARVFYARFQKDILKLWRKIKGKQVLRPSIWSQFVESRELWDLGWEQFSMLSEFSQAMGEEGELPEDGMTAFTQEREEYFLVPLQHATASVPEGASVLEVA